MGGGVYNHFITLSFSDGEGTFNGSIQFQITLGRDTPLTQNEFLYNMPYDVPLFVSGYGKITSQTGGQFNTLTRTADTRWRLGIYDPNNFIGATRDILLNYIQSFSDVIINY